MTFPFRGASHAGHAQENGAIPMTSNGKYISLHNLRVQRVQKALKDHSSLDDKTSFDLAEHVLDALDHIPEKRH